MLAIAQSGAGKTAAYVLPLLQRLQPAAEDAPRPIRGLILAPTRELVANAAHSLRIYGAHLRLRAAALLDVATDAQLEALRPGVDVLVAHPRALLDAMRRAPLDLGRVEMLVLDEADGMLGAELAEAVRPIVAALPAGRQTVLVAASPSDALRSFAEGVLRDPVTAEAAPRAAPGTLPPQYAYAVEAGRKRELLMHLAQAGDWRRVLVFVRTRHAANRLSEQLGAAGVESDAVHGNRSQNARVRALKRFKEGKLRVLIATDAAARSFDLEGLPLVVSYDLPHAPEDYLRRVSLVHLQGEALSFVAADERPMLAAIEQLIARTIEMRVVPEFAPQPEAQAQAPVPAPRAPQHEQRPVQPGGRAGRRRRRGRPPGQDMRRSAPPPMPRGAGSPPGAQGGRPDGRHRAAPRRDEHRVYADRDEREAQLREARMRLAEERGESPAEDSPPAGTPRRDTD